MRPDDRRTRDLKCMARCVVRGVGEVDEHSKSGGFDKDQFSLVKQTAIYTGSSP